MKRFIKRAFNRLPFVQNLRSQIDKQGLFPAGHHHSPIPSGEDVRRQLAARDLDRKNLPDIDLNNDGHLKLLKEYQAYYNDVPFSEQKSPTYRYYYAQNWFCYADAIFLYSFLRKHKPQRIIEVGSGFSSAVMLDTAEHFFQNEIEFVCIEPSPARLLSLLKPGDASESQSSDPPCRTRTSSYSPAWRLGISCLSTRAMS